MLEEQVSFVSKPSPLSDPRRSNDEFWPTRHTWISRFISEVRTSVGNDHLVDQRREAASPTTLLLVKVKT